MKFTCEMERDACLNFLDVLVKRMPTCFTTSVYYKPTYSGLYTKFSSFLPFPCKIALIKTLIHRIFRICSSYIDFSKDIEVLKKTLAKNEFPMSLVDRSIGNFLDKTFGVRKEIKSLCDKLQYTLVVPFTGIHGQNVKKKLIEIVGKHYPQLRLSFVYRPTLRIANLFKVKDRLPTSLCSNVVYKYTCSSCQASYIGETRRHIGVRQAEHIGISFSTNKPIKGDQKSAVHKHIAETRHIGSNDSFKIIARASNRYDLAIKESLYIARDHPRLNNNISSFPLHLF